MQRAERENGDVPPSIDIPSVVKGVLSGDEESIRQLDGALRQKLMPFFIRRNPNQAQDLTQETVIKVFYALPNFRGEGNNYSNIFWKWTYVIGINNYFEQHRKSIRHRFPEVPLTESVQSLPIEQPSSEMKYDITNETVLNVIKDKFSDLLSPLELRTVEQKISGKSNKEISLIEQVTEVCIRVRISRARRKIEREILEKTGFKPTNAFGDSRFQTAVAHGRVRSIKILGRYYLRDEDAKNYKRREIDQDLLGNGYVLLSEATTLSEYFHFKNSEIPLRHDGRLYMKTGDLEEFRKRHKNRRQGRTFPPSLNHE